MSAICIVILYLIKVQVNTRFKKHLKIPLPVELFVVSNSSIQSNLPYVTFHGKIEIGSHKTDGHYIEVY